MNPDGSFKGYTRWELLVWALAMTASGVTGLIMAPFGLPGWSIELRVTRWLLDRSDRRMGLLGGDAE